MVVVADKVQGAAQKRREAARVAQAAREKANRELVAAASVELPAKRPSKQVRFLRRLAAARLREVA